MDRKTVKEKELLLPYLLGELNEQEEALVTEALQKNASLREEYSRLEADFEKMAHENAIAPPASIRKALETSISQVQDTAHPGVRTLKPANTFDKTRLLVAASLAALFALTSFWMYNRWQQAEENIRLVKEEQRELRENLERLSTEMQGAQELNAMLNDRDAIPLVLKGNSLSPDARAIAYVNHKTRSVLVNPKALPQLSAEETYQMWADVDGEMINMGLVPTDEDLVFLTYIDRAESLNITIEPRGGSDHPTVERLISNVYL